VIDRLAANGIDLTKMPVEVAPIAHYHMGGVLADVAMQTEVPGLIVAGEAVGGANGANRLSGNAITEAFVFGREAGRTAAARAKTMRAVPASNGAANATADLIRSGPLKDAPNSAEMLQRLQATMSNDVGPLRTRDGLDRALGTIDELTNALGDRPFGDGGSFDMQRLDWFDLRNMLTVAGVVTRAASLRTESRGAHQREDFPEMLPQWRVNQTVRLRGERLEITQAPASPVEVAAQ
jgi:succinate dehydrogenase / fumarate reductase flavoprotein subunit